MVTLQVSTFNLPLPSFFRSIENLSLVTFGSATFLPGSVFFLPHYTPVFFSSQEKKSCSPLFFRNILLI